MYNVGRGEDIMPRHKSPMLTFVIPKLLLERIDDYRFEHRFKSRAAAIKHLIKWALDQNAPPPAKHDDEDS